MEADALSRNPILEPYESNSEQLTVVNLITLIEILQYEQENKNLQNEHKNLLSKIIFIIKIVTK